ncbi:MAG: DUF4426 domain-containing protein, partial [Gammaproteobacteria bacterium]
MTRTAAGILCLAMGILPLTLKAEQSRDFGDYTVHYSAFTTDILSPEVAGSYGIRRSSNRILLNISVLKKVMGTSAQPVRAAVKATATNLSSQLREVEMRELNEHGAIYYIGELKVEHGETLTFDLAITPHDAD